MKNDTCKIMIGRTYEANETAFVEKQVRNGSIFIDVGAHIGYYTTIASKCVGETGKVYSFEPNRENFAALTKNTRGLENVTISNLALADFTGMSLLNLSDSNSGDHRLCPVEGRKQQVTNVITLDAYWGSGGHPIDFIKIDVQGFELHVLRGAAKLIERSPNICGIVEFSPDLLQLAGTDPVNLLTWLRDRGFNLFVARTGAKMNLRTPEAYSRLKHHINILFSHGEISV
jgi:FkbM family methyltransferase